MKIYITNLKSSTERRRHMQKECAKENLEYSFFDCVVGSELQDTEIAEKCDIETISRYKNKEHWLNKGIIGCTLTNQNVYRDIISNDYPFALYLEDDIKFANGFKQLLIKIGALVQPGDVILLNYLPKRTLELKPVKILIGNYGLYGVENPEAVGGGAAFVVTRDAAEKMLLFNTPIRITPDCWGDYKKASAIKRLLCVYPMPVTGIFVQSTMQIGRFLKLRNFINQYRIFPFYGMIKLYKRIKRKGNHQIKIINTILVVLHFLNP